MSTLFFLTSVCLLLRTLFTDQWDTYTQAKLLLIYSKHNHRNYCREVAKKYHQRSVVITTIYLINDKNWTNKSYDAHSNLITHSKLHHSHNSHTYTRNPHWAPDENIFELIFYLFLLLDWRAIHWITIRNAGNR